MKNLLAAVTILASLALALGRARRRRRQYPGIIPTSIECSGILMRGYPPWLSSSVAGPSRDWDKLLCTGWTWSSPRSVFSLVFDQKSRSSWIIYRLRGSSLTELRTAGP